MVLASPLDSPPPDTLPQQILRAALHRVEGQRWWFHRLLAEVGYSVLLLVWFFRAAPVAVILRWDASRAKAYMDRTDDAVVARVSFLAGRRSRS